MKSLRLAALVMVWILSLAVSASSQEGHMKGMDMPMKHTNKKASTSTLQPAEGASVKIVSPKAGEVLKGDQVPLQFKLTKGKRGEHVHAYVDGEMMGMFKSEKGTLTGIKPGPHTLELRVVTGDHNTELDASDKVIFVTK
jgi:Penicillin-Binding Protein C-terminus Family